jgi:hypothetical protein
MARRAGHRISIRAIDRGRQPGRPRLNGCFYVWPLSALLVAYRTTPAADSSVSGTK